MQTNHYDDTEFRLALRLSMEAAWQRDQIAQTVPDSVEQVRAQQILPPPRQAQTEPSTASMLERTLPGLGLQP